MKSYQQTPCRAVKKTGRKRETSPYDPYKRKARGKESKPGFKSPGLPRVRAHVRAEEKTREEKLFEAEMRLADAEKSHLIPVLLLIVKNGNNRQESIRQMMIRGESEKSARKRYERHRKTLLTFFDVA